MKIERINDNQIRCTLNKSDLASRHLKISELAYGSEKARELFRDMMKQANSEFGFESEDLPLMIEAIPVSSECIVLIITKVENPEELDTRFSRFSDADEEDNDFNDDDDFDDFDDEDNDDGVVTLSEELDSVENLDSEMGEINSDLMNIFSQVKDYLNKKNISTKDSNNFVPFSKSI
jgi:adapter protein MecA 1/2